MIGLNPNNYSHLTEHLAPLCVIMDVPLLLTDEDYSRKVQSLYPRLKVLLVAWEEVTPRYLIENFEVCLQSEPWNRHDFYRTFDPLEEKYKKVMRCVHCPHGFSDKIFWLEKCVYEDITLVYGDNMLDLFKASGLYNHLNIAVRTGNYRYAYYKRHQAFFDHFVEEEVWKGFSSQQPTILYAPTCNQMDSSSSFLEADPLFELLPAHFNMIVKIHPALEETDPSSLYRMMGKYEKKNNIVFIKDLPLVYPLLARSDIYIGDMSSIGYDFLTFNRPMFFLNHTRSDPKTDRNLFLYRCGIEVKPEHYGEIYSIIATSVSSDQEKFSKVRKDVYDYTFGHPLADEEIRLGIKQACSSPKKYD